MITQKNIHYYRIKHLAQKYGWQLLKETSDTLVFRRTEMGYIEPSVVTLRINFIKMEIQTILYHPKKGDTQLNRHGAFSMNLIEKIFRNPRVHTPVNIKTEYK